MRVLFAVSAADFIGISEKVKYVDLPAETLKVRESDIYIQDRGLLKPRSTKFSNSRSQPEQKKKELEMKMR